MSDIIIQLNEEAAKGKIKDIVHKRVKETLNEMLKQEAEELIVATKYERM